MHAHVSYLTDDCPACLLMLTVERDAFFELSAAKQKIVTVKIHPENNSSWRINTYIGGRVALSKFILITYLILQGLEKAGALKTITENIQICRYVPSTIGVPDIKHFLYKSKTTAQFTGSEYIAPYLDEKSQERLQNIYLFLQGQLHAASRTAKLVYYTGKFENIFSWVCSINYV